MLLASGLGRATVQLGSVATAHARRNRRRSNVGWAVGLDIAARLRQACVTSLWVRIVASGLRAVKAARARSWQSFHVSGLAVLPRLGIEVDVWHQTGDCVPGPVGSGLAGIDGVHVAPDPFVVDRRRS